MQFVELMQLEQLRRLFEQLSTARAELRDRGIRRRSCLRSAPVPRLDDQRPVERRQCAEVLDGG
ncbi:hypothetical protein LGM42_26050, partial [Burkholderia sp. AU39826]|uniref:hypothetical protein n=1 Tax=Burkholderia sp. AU39826 TaxID=2879634 RepID=UPI001CF25466